jgi:anti-anti-sigma regulatory factor
MLRIERFENGEIVLALYGRIESHNLAELELLVDREIRRPLCIDLREVTLIDRDVVKFLARCEIEAIQLRNCPRYIRELIDEDK